MKGILDKYHLNPTNSAFLDDIEDNAIAHWESRSIRLRKEAMLSVEISKLYI